MFFPLFHLYCSRYFRWRNCYQKRNKHRKTPEYDGFLSLKPTLSAPQLPGCETQGKNLGENSTKPTTIPQIKLSSLNMRSRSRKAELVTCPNEFVFPQSLLIVLQQGCRGSTSMVLHNLVQPLPLIPNCPCPHLPLLVYRFLLCWYTAKYVFSTSAMPLFCHLRAPSLPSSIPSQCLYMRLQRPLSDTQDVLQGLPCRTTWLR